MTTQSAPIASRCIVVLLKWHSVIVCWSFTNLTLHYICAGDTHKLGQHQQIALILDLAQFDGGKLDWKLNLVIFMATDTTISLTSHTFLKMFQRSFYHRYLSELSHVHNSPLPEAANSLHDVRSFVLTVGTALKMFSDVLCSVLWIITSCNLVDE